MKHTLLSATVCAAVGLFSASACAHKANDIILRVGLTSVAPHDKSGDVFVDGAGNLGMGAQVNSNTQLGLNLAYMLDDHWAIELLAATPFTHDIKLVDSNDNALGLGDGKLAETKHLPPTLSALYYFNSSTAFLPYLGFGLNYTVFFDEDFTGGRADQSFRDLSLDNAFGLSVQAGFDYQVNSRWLMNGSVRYIDIDTEANFMVLDLPGKVSVDIDPYVYTLSVGYLF